MSFGHYLFGVIGLALVAIPMAMGGVRLRGRLLPGWVGAPARLAEAVLAVALLTILLQLLGAFGILVPGVLIPAALLLGLGLYYGVRGAFRSIRPVKRPRTRSGAPPAPAIPLPQLLLALLAAAFVAAHWATGLQDVWARGMLTFDTLWYHGPFAARIADTGSVWGMHFTDPLYLNWFYPENSELLHGAGITLFDRDIFSPFVNFGWLGVALLAAWCIGRPYGVAPLSLTAVAIAMDTGPMVPREAGTPATDTVPVAMLLAAAAILINAWAAREGSSVVRRGAPAAAPSAAAPLGAILVAGLAIGIALGSKLTIWGVAVAFAIGVPFLVPRELRWKAFWIFVGGVAAVSAFWFLRNLVHAGNPLPWIRHIGPIDLPGPNRGLEGRTDFTVAHYLFSDPSTGRLAPVLPQPDRESVRAPLVPDPGRSLRRRDPLDLEAALARGPPGGSGDDRCRDRLPLHPAHGRRSGGAPAGLRHQPPLPDPRRSRSAWRCSRSSRGSPRSASGCRCS